MSCRSSNPPPDARSVTPPATDRALSLMEWAIVCIWREIDGDNLPRWEQSLLIQQMRAILAEPPSPPTHRLNAEQVIEAAGSFYDE